MEIDDFEDANLAYANYYPKKRKSTKTSKSLRKTKKPYHPMSPDLRVCDIIRLVFKTKVNFIVDKYLSTRGAINFFLKTFEAMMVITDPVVPVAKTTNKSFVKLH